MNPGPPGPYQSQYQGAFPISNPGGFPEDPHANSAANGHALVEESSGNPTYLLHKSQFPLYAVGFSNRRLDGLTAAVGSFLPSEQNFISILEVPPDRSRIICTKQIPQRYPATMIRFQPHSDVSLKAPERQRCPGHHFRPPAPLSLYR